MKTTHPMKRTFRTAVLPAALLLSLLLIGGDAFGNAFFLQEMSGDGVGQAAATVAGGRRPSSMFQNAANIAHLEGGFVEASGTLFFPDASFTSAAGKKTKGSSDPIFAPQFFFSYKLPMVPWLTFGFGEFVDFGLTIKWPKDWEGGYLVTEAGLESITLNPNVAFGPFFGDTFKGGGLSVAVGYDAKWGAVNIKRKLTMGTMQRAGEDPAANTVHLGGDTWGHGVNVGLIFKPLKWMSFGAAYRSAITMHLNNGRADFDVNDAFASRFPDQGFKAKITLPHLISTGVRFWPVEDLSIELDCWVTLWSSYDKLVFKFSEGLEQSPNVKIKRQVEKKNYHDAIQLRLGAEYLFPQLDHHLAARLGLMWDGNVVPDETVDPMLPDNHRVNFAAGLGTEWFGFYFDVGYMLVYFLDRDVSNVAANPLPGKYKVITHVLTGTLGYHW